MKLVKKVNIMAVYKDPFFLEFINRLLLPYGASVVGTNLVPMIDDFYRLNTVDLTLVEQELATSFTKTTRPFLVLPNCRELKKSTYENPKRYSLFALHEIWKALYSRNRPGLNKSERAYQRVNASLTLQWRPMLDLHFQDAEVLNISPGGIGMTTQAITPHPGDIVEVSAGTPLHGFGVVRWTNINAGLMQTDFGVEFVATSKMVLLSESDIDALPAITISS